MTAAAGLHPAWAGVEGFSGEPPVFAGRHEERVLLLVGAHGGLPALHLGLVDGIGRQLLDDDGRQMPAGRAAGL